MPVSSHLRLFHAHKDEKGNAHSINVNDIHRESHQRFNDKVAKVTTTIYGSMWFVYFLAAATFGWMLWQSYLTHKPFDPYPFAFLLFMGNLIQLLGGPIIQVGQNLSSAHSELRAESDFEVNKESFTKLETVEQHLLKQDEAILQILTRMEHFTPSRIERLSPPSPPVA